MNRLKRTFFVLLAFTVVTTTLLGSITAVLFPQSALAETVSLSDSTVPQGPNDEVGWWVDRTLIVLFNNTVPVEDGATGTLSGMYNNTNKALGSGDMEYSDSNGCKMTVNFASDNSKPSRGKLSGDSCKNTQKTVRLEKKDRAIIDGYWDLTSTDASDKGIRMMRALSRLVNCGSDGREVKADDNSYREAYFKKSEGRKGVTWKKVDGGSGTQVGLKDLDTKASPMTSKQVAYCPDGDHGFGGYGVTGDLSSDKFGRTVYLDKTQSQDMAKDSAQEAANSFHTQKAKQAEFFKFFNSTNLGIVKSFCVPILPALSGKSDAEIRQYATDTLVKPIPGPFSDCLRKAFANNEEFSRIDSIVASGDVGAPPPAGSDEECSGGPAIIGDLICWLGEAIFDGVNSIFTGVIEYFASPPNLIANSDSQIQATWANLRNVANVLFVLAFLTVIFQYVTNVSVAEAYFVKKFIPRLVLAVILTQASGWIASELAFLVHDLGSSIQSIVFWGGGQGFQAGSGAMSVLSGGAMIALFLGAGGFAMIVAALFLGIILLLILIITIVVLAVRHILIIVLAIFAPLAFACLAIPQLEGVFKKWIKMYVQLLMMYPIIMLMIAAAGLLSGTLSGGGTFEQLIGLVVQFIPYFILPFTFKFAGGMMGNVTAKMAKGIKGGIKMGQKGKNLYETKTQGGMARARKREALKSIKADRAAAAGGSMASQALAKARGRSGTLGKVAQRRTFGAGATDAEMAKYSNLFEEKEKKRKAEEAAAAVAHGVAGTRDQSSATAYLDKTYRDAMAAGDMHTANAAYSSLVDYKATDLLSQIQADADAGTWNRGQFGTDSAGNMIGGDQIYNQQQGASYSKLGEFAPHLRGDVNQWKDGAKVDLNATRLKNLKSLSDDQLAGVKPEAWDAYAQIDAHGAAERYFTIKNKGGGAASKLNPDALKKIMAESDAELERTMSSFPAGPARDTALADAKRDRDNYLNTVGKP